MGKVIDINGRLRTNKLDQVLSLINSFEDGTTFFRGVSNLEFISDGEVVAATEYDHSQQRWVSVEV